MFEGKIEEPDIGMEYVMTYTGDQVRDPDQLGQNSNRKSKIVLLAR